MIYTRRTFSLRSFQATHVGHKRSTKPSSRRNGFWLARRSSASQPEAERLGDVHQVAKRLRTLSNRLLHDPAAADDDDYRLASALDQLAQQMSPEHVDQRPVNFEEQIEGIRDTVFLTDSPWRDPGALPRFGEAYNAATLKSWYVPKLLVDPGGEWRRRISSSGPQLVTGMRGCGKTMLLRALEVHSRAVEALEKGGFEPRSSALGYERTIGWAYTSQPPDSWIPSATTPRLK